MDTNRQGNGNGHVVLDVSQELGDAVYVQVVVKPEDDPYGWTGYASDYVPVPMK